MKRVAKKILQGEGGHLKMTLSLLGGGVKS